MDKDIEHLRLLTIFHYVAAGAMAFFSSFALIHLSLGLLMLLNPEGFGGTRSGEAPPALVGWIFTIMGAGFLLGGWSLATAIFFAGRFLKRRTHYIYCLVVAGLSCMFAPIGTALGVSTIMVLMRSSVKQLFQTEPAGMGSIGALPDYSVNGAIPERQSRKASVPREPPDWR